MFKLRHAIVLPIVAFSLLCHAADTSGKVVIAGAGSEPYVNTILDGIADQLKAAGVPVKPFVGDAKSRSAAMESLKSSPGDSLLYVTVEVQEGIPVKAGAQCFDRDGNKLWEESGSGGLSFGHSMGVRNALKKLSKNIEKHIGQPGLPKA